MTPDYTPLLIFALILAIGWGAIQHKRANQNLADRDRLNGCLKDAVKQYEKERLEKI